MITTTGMRNAIIIPQSKVKKSIPNIEYTTKFDETLNSEGNTGVVHGSYGTTYLDAMPEFKNLRDIIVYYRVIENYPDVAKAIMNIEMEMFPPDPSDDYFMSVNFKEDSKLSKDVQSKLRSEFHNVIDIVDRNYGCEKLFHIWYVDGRCVVYKIIDTEHLNKGLLDIQVLDPINVFPIKVVDKVIRDDIERVKIVEDFYVYQPNQTNSLTSYYSRISTQNIKIDKDLIAYNFSGHRNTSLGYLHSAIKPINVLSMLEDAAAIYRIARAPERRVYYVDVGTLPAKAADAHLKKIIKENSTKISYDAKFGEIKSKRRHALPMLEDIFLPRREGSRGTEISTLQGGQQLGEVQDIEYFQHKARQSLYVPMSRFEDQTSSMMMGMSSRNDEIGRDEMLFAKFIGKLKRQHFKLYEELWRTQCILKGVVSENDWESIINDTIPTFPKSNKIERQMELNTLQTQIDLLSDVQELVGVYYTDEDIQKTILGRNDDDILRFREKLKAEIKDGIVQVEERE